jgi:ABC-type transport system substrate-binding protein/class 3 adenylate cyclase
MATAVDADAYDVPSMTTDGAAGNPSAEERRIITVLFADLVGSTALAERLDPEETRLIVGDAIRRVVEAVELYGGHVKDLAGDGVLAFFGAPIAHEDDAERAVLAGLRIASEVADHAAEVERAWGITGVGIRIGINTGPVVLGSIGGGRRVEYAAFGDTVNAAARLQAAADPGSVLVADGTRRPIETHYEWGERRRLELKGRGEPMHASVALRPAAGVDHRRAESNTELVGRDRELAAIDDVLGRVTAGTGGVLLLTGEAGIGKSRLLHELRDRFLAAPSPMGAPVWLEGRCVSYGESLPSLPFREIVRDWIGVGVDDPELRVRLALRRRVDELFGPQAPEIYPYLATLLDLALEPDARARVAELSPEALQYRTFEVVRLLVARLAEDGPVAVVIDDLHWADPTSIQLAGSLLGVTEESAVLLVFAMRSERDRPAWRVREQASVEVPHRLVELALEGLGADADRRLLDSLVGADTLPAELARRLLEEAEGNPFFLEELVRSITDAGAVVSESGGWRFDREVPLHVPETVEQVILARIARLDPAAKRVLTAASVLGRRFGQGLLEQIVDPGEEVRASLTELQRLDLVRESRRWPQPEYRFKHVLIQEAAYGTIVGATRRELHRRAAEWLERRRDEGGEASLDLLAHHWLAAEDEERAIRYLTLAGDRARLSWSLDEAVGHYRALLPLLEGRGERRAVAIVLFKLGLSLHNALRFAEANETYQRAFERWDPPEEAPTVDATLHFSTPTLPSEPDPCRSYFPPDIRLQMALFDRLVERWPEATIVPSLAERWEISDDGKRYLFHLRAGLHWSDGVPLTARDVEFGVKRNLDPDRLAPSAGLFFVIEHGQDYALRRHSDLDRIGVRAIDDLTVEFRLAAPAPYFLSLINRPDAGPQPRHAIERHGDAWLDPDHQVVSGAFRQVVREPDRLEIARRTDANTPRRGNVERVVWTPGDATAMLAAHRDGTADLVEPFMGSITAIGEAARQDLVLGPPAWLSFLAFDFSDPSVATLDVRRALAHAIDRDRLADAVRDVGMVYTVATGGVVPPAIQGHTPDIAPLFDPDLARQLLADTGVDEIRIVLPPVNGRPTALAAADSWEANLPVRVVRIEVDPEAWYASDDLFEFGPIVPRGWFPGYPDPEYFLRLLLHSDSHDISAIPEQRYRSDAFDALIEEARQEPDGTRRLELFHSADRLVIRDEIGMIAAYYGRNPYLVQPWVEGWWEFGKSWSSFADLEVRPRTGGR